MDNFGPLWAIVLAAEPARRTRGRELDLADRGPRAADPISPESLERSLAIAARLVPPHRTLVSIPAAVMGRVRPSLAALPAENLIDLPHCRGSAPALLLALCHLLRRDPSAKLVVLHAHHRVSDEAVFAQGLLAAAEATPGRDNRGVLLGMKPFAPEPDHDWVLPSSRGVGPTYEVGAFSADPDPASRALLFEGGGLLASGVVAASTSALLRLFDHGLPGLLRSFLVNLRGRHLGSSDVLAMLYRYIPRRDVLRDLVIGAPEVLRVLPVPACGWSGDTPRARRREDHPRALAPISAEHITAA